MIAILDVSGAIEIILKKEKASKYQKVCESASWVIAPELYIAELTNVLWKYYKARIITREECIEYVDNGIQLVDDFICHNELWKEALGEGIKNNNSIYDMYYAIVARRNEGIVITNDKELSSICRKLKIEYCM